VHRHAQHSRKVSNENNNRKSRTATTTIRQITVARVVGIKRMVQCFLTGKPATKVLSIPVHDLDFIPGFPACPCQFSFQNFDTSSLNPAFSPRRRRIVRRLSEKPATGLAG
jgi:hypothetical protein